MESLHARFSLMGPDIPTDTIIVNTNGLKIGRLADNDLALNHREISRQHLRIIWRDEKYFVEDLNSSNGVFLNDERLKPREPEELKLEDSIRFGPFQLRLMDWITPEPMAFQLPSIFADGFDLSIEPSSNGYHHMEYPVGVPRPPQKSNWLQYLPAIYSDSDNGFNVDFVGRYLLIFESLLSPIIWTIDNFDLFFSPELAPTAWLEWMASWFDMLLLPELPIERQREILRQIGWLFMRRGTPAGLQRLLELYFGVTPEIIENEPCHFVVKLALSQSSVELGADVADRLIASQKPAFASYTLEVT